MSARLSFLRRIAVALADHAANVLPSTQYFWAAGMRNELEHIEGDAEALRWAVGCVLASYVERSRVRNVLHTWYARGLLMLLITGEMWSMLFATILTAAYRLHYAGIAAFLGGFTPGDDYRRFIPVMEVMPWWVHGMWVAAAALFGASGWQLLRDKRAAFPLFAAA